MKEFSGKKTSEVLRLLSSDTYGSYRMVTYATALRGPDADDDESTDVKRLFTCFIRADYPYGLGFRSFLSLVASSDPDHIVDIARAVRRNRHLLDHIHGALKVLASFLESDALDVCNILIHFLSYGNPDIEYVRRLKEIVDMFLAE